MKQINLLGYQMKILSFDEDGIYSIMTSNENHIRYCEIDDSEIKTLKENIEKVTLPQVVDGDVLYFDKSASFPKLMLGRLDLGVKRTIKSDKSTKIVVDESIIINKSELENLESGYVVMVGGSGEDDFNQIFYISDKNIEDRIKNGITLELMQRYFPGIWKKVTLLNDHVTDSSIKLINSDPEKLVSVQNVAAYLNSKLPALDHGSAETMISLFKAGAEEKKLAVNMMSSFNISTILFDICDAIGNSSGYFDSATKSSINYKYLKMLIGVNPSTIESDWRYRRWNLISIISKLFNKALMSPDQKHKAWVKFKKLVEDSAYGYNNEAKLESVKRTFKQYNMPLTYDPKRETSTVDSKVEGE